MQSGLKNSFECVVSLGETDFTHDLERIDVPTLLIHGDDDQVVPVNNSERSARIIKNARDIYYPGAPHGLTATHQDKVNVDLLAFLEDRPPPTPPTRGRSLRDRRRGPRGERAR